MTDRLLSTREVADWLGVSPETVLRRWRRGEIPGYRLASNVLRFREADLEAWLAGAREGPAAGGEVLPTPTAVPTRALFSQGYRPMNRGG